MAGTQALIAQLELRARDRLPREVYDYVAGGSGEEVTLDESAAAWRSYRLRPRVLGAGTGPVTTATELLGAALPSPVGIAPVGFQQLVHPDGECAIAAGADGHLMIASARSDSAVEHVAAAATGPWWHQHYATVDDAVGLGLAERAAAAGAGALVLTVDTPYVAAKARQGRIRAIAAGAEQRPATADDVGRLRALTGLPVLVKGVLRSDDAARALDAGAAGIVVSTHGGRQLDRAVASAHALAEVVAAAGDVPVLVDGGVRSGLDVLVALALGARAVLLGRPVVWSLAVGGADGVRDLLAAVTAEFGHVLGLAGCASPSGVGPDLVHRPGTR